MEMLNMIFDNPIDNLGATIDAIRAGLGRIERSAETARNNSQGNANGSSGERQGQGVSERAPASIPETTVPGQWSWNTDGDGDGTGEQDQALAENTWDATLADGAREGTNMERLERLVRDLLRFFFSSAAVPIILSTLSKYNSNAVLNRQITC
jgi:hypothetical protein